MPFVPRSPRKTDYVRNRGAHYSKSAKLYSCVQWKRTRMVQLSRQPLCQRCTCYGKVVVATDVDHVYPHKGDYDKFFTSELCSLCHSCHAWKTQQENLGRIYTWRDKSEVLLNSQHPR